MDGSARARTPCDWALIEEASIDRDPSTAAAEASAEEVALAAAVTAAGIGSADVAQLIADLPQA